MVLPAGWTPERALPTGVSRRDGFLGSDAEKQEAEQSLKIKVSADPSLWEENDFQQYVSNERRWVMTAFDRVVLLATYLQLRAAKGFYAQWSRCDYYEEYIDLPLVGQSIFNRWVVHGYVSPRQRVCRSTEGNNYGKWALVTLEPESNEEVLTQRWESSDGSTLLMTFAAEGRVGA